MITAYLKAPPEKVLEVFNCGWILEQYLGFVDGKMKLIITKPNPTNATVTE